MHSWLDGRSFSSQDASIDENLELTNAINYKLLSHKKTQEQPPSNFRKLDQKEILSQIDKEVKF